MQPCVPEFVNVAPTPVPFEYVADKFAVVPTLQDGLVSKPCATWST